MNNNIYYQNPSYNQSGDRFVGGFAFPFLLGGVTGAAIALSAILLWTLL